MDKAERIYTEILKEYPNTDAAVIAKFVLRCCTEPERRLKGLLELLKDGAEIQCVPNDIMFDVVIDGVYHTMVKFSEV